MMVCGLGRSHLRNQKAEAQEMVLQALALCSQPLPTQEGLHVRGGSTGCVQCGRATWRAAGASAGTPCTGWPRCASATCRTTQGAWRMRRRQGQREQQAGAAKRGGWAGTLSWRPWIQSWGRQPSWCSGVCGGAQVWVPAGEEVPLPDWARTELAPGALFSGRLHPWPPSPCPGHLPRVAGSHLEAVTAALWSKARAGEQVQPA